VQRAGGAGRNSGTGAGIRHARSSRAQRAEERVANRRTARRRAPQALTLYRERVGAAAADARLVEWPSRRWPRPYPNRPHIAFWLSLQVNPTSPKVLATVRRSVFIFP
jgi:hypothetical protein